MITMSLLRLSCPLTKFSLLPPTIIFFIDRSLQVHALILNCCRSNLSLPLSLHRHHHTEHRVVFDIWHFCQQPEPTFEGTTVT